MKMINSFFLVGPMGVGKTTVGQALAEQLGFSFIDSDAYIENQAGQSIADLFATQGEVAFRDLETKAIDALSLLPNIVLSTGGGAILRQVNRDYLKSRGTVIFLDLAPSAIFERIKGDQTRPLLKTTSPLGTLQNIYDERHPIYLDAAHYRILVEGRSPQEISDLLFSLYNDPMNVSADWCIPLKDLKN